MIARGAKRKVMLQMRCDTNNVAYDDVWRLQRRSCMVWALLLLPILFDVPRVPANLQRRCTCACINVCRMIERGDYLTVVSGSTNEPQLK